MTAPLASAATSTRDPLLVLRAYHQLAPWSLKDLSALAGTLLEASAVVPVNVAARARPSERTIRFYVAQGLVDPPEGRGTAAVYRYRHLLKVLGIKLRQMEGGSLESVRQEFSSLTGDSLERKVASALGAGMPSPEELGGTDARLPARGRSGRVLRRPADAGEGESAVHHSAIVRRLAIAAGAELYLEASHPLFRHAAADASVARAVAAALETAEDELTSR